MPRLLQLVAALVVSVLLVLAVGGGELATYDAYIPGYDNTDHAGAVYLHHQFIDRLAEGKLPGFDPLQLYPEGTWLVRLHGGNSLEMLVSWVLSWFLAWPAWFSWAHLAWLPLNLLAFLPLGRQLWGRTGPALAAGAAWAVLPYHLGEIASGRLTQVALVGLPLAVAGLLRVCERDGGWRDRLLAGGGFALTGLGYWYYAIFLALCGPLFLVWGLVKRGRAAAVDLAWSAAVALGVVLPFALPVLWPRLSGSWVPAPPLDPSTANPVFDNALQLFSAQPVQLVGWFPWILLLGFAATAWKGQRRLLLVGLTLFCLICALGPAQYQGRTLWHLPYELLWRTVPLLDRLTHPGRWLGIGGLFLVLLAADGLARWRPWATWVLPVGVIVQLWTAGNLPLGTWKQELPPVWKAVAAQEEQGALLVLPLLNSPLTCRWQPFHGRPMLGGMVEHMPWAWSPSFRELVSDSPMLMALYALGRGKRTDVPVLQDDLARLRELGFDTVVLDRESWRWLSMMPGSDVNLPVERLVTEALGTPLFRDDTGVVWRLPEQGRSGQAPPAPIELPPP